MLNQRFSIAKLLLGAVAALSFTAAPALAASHGHAGSAHGVGHAGSAHGAGHAGSYHGGGHYSGYRDSRYAGYHGGHYAYYGGRRGFYGGYGLGLGSAYGLGTYPYYYGNDYYPYDYGYAYSPTYYVTPPATNVIVPPDTSVSNYYSPAPADDSAHVSVLTPSPDAEVFFNGTATQQRGTDREFVSPPLTPGQPYTYNIEARWMESGRMVDQTRAISVTAGQTVTVDFTR